VKNIIVLLIAVFLISACSSKKITDMSYYKRANDVNKQALEKLDRE
jgi:PBP1b-binding outer membrane lipoprotein LpoB